MNYTREECAAALLLAADVAEGNAARSEMAERGSGVILRALAAALEDALPCKYLNEAEQLVPGWHIPVPEAKP